MARALLGRIYRRFATPILRTRQRAWIFLIGVGLATVAVCVLFYTESVTVKLLPFDNKSEMSVVVDLPEGATLEDTERTLFAIADVARNVPEVRSIETYAGTPAPFNFNGLVRHYYVRQSPELGELHLNLAPKAERDRTSHEIALDLRARLKQVTLPAGTVARVVEVPPGPPVLATLLAEVYGPDSQTRRAVAHEVEEDLQVGALHRRRRRFHRPAAAAPAHLHRPGPAGILRRRSSRTSTTPSRRCSAARTIGYSHRGEGRNPIEIVVGLPKRDLSWSELLASTPVPANTVPGNKAVVELGDVVHVTKELGSPTIFRRDGRFTDMVMAEMAGAYEAPIYGMLAVDKLIDAARLGQARRSPPSTSTASPQDESQADAAVGRRVGDHLCHLPRHGRRLHGRHPRHLHPGGGAVRQLQAAAGDPDADPADADRHRARPLAVRRAVHRHLDDRLHRARRHHRAQLDPAGRLHPPRRRQRARPCARCCWRPARCASSRSC